MRRPLVIGRRGDRLQDIESLSTRAAVEISVRCENLCSSRIVRKPLNHRDVSWSRLSARVSARVVAPLGRLRGLGTWRHRAVLVAVVPSDHRRVVVPISSLRYYPNAMYHFSVNVLVRPSLARQSPSLISVSGT